MLLSLVRFIQLSSKNVQRALVLLNLVRLHWTLLALSRDEAQATWS